MSYELGEARELVIKAGLKLKEMGLIARTWGNISARISDTQFVITPSGRSYESLIPEDIVIVNIKDCSYEGEILPSGEVSTHAAVYKQKKDVNFVVHTHQLYASAISITADDLNDIASYNGTTDSGRSNYDSILGASIPCASYAMSSTEALAKQVRKCIKKNPQAKVIMLKSHGILCMAANYDEAFLLSEATEEIAKSRYEYICSNYTNEADINVEYDYGYSYRSEGRIYLTVGEDTMSWPVGYAKKSKRSDVPRRYRAVAMLHDLVYDDININYVSHVTSPYVTMISRLGKGFKPYIDDQCQIIGTDVKCAIPRIKRNKLRSIKKLDRMIADRNALLLSSGGALCYGGSQDDVDAAASVLEKGCVAAMLAYLLGVVKPVPKKVSAQMRDKYRNSYSKLKDYGLTATTLKEINESISETAPDSYKDN